MVKNDAMIHNKEILDKNRKDYIIVRNPTTGGVRVFESEQDIARKLGTNSQALKNSCEYIVEIGPPPEPLIQYL